MYTLRLALIIGAAAAIVGCATPQPDFVRPAGSPTYAPTRFVEMLDTAPTRQYVEIGVIELTGEPGALRAQVLAQINSKAQQIGADAVILTDLSRPAPSAPRLNPTTGQYDTTGGQLIPAFKGVAIKYR